MEQLMEETIKYLQANGGNVNIKKIPVWVTYTEQFHLIRQRLANYGLIVIPTALQNSNEIILTEKGWEFESFAKIREEKNLQREMVASNNEAAKATKTVSDQTGTFYGKQHKYNIYQIVLTIVIGGAAVASAVIAGMSYFKDKESRKSQDTLIQSLIETQQSIEESLHKKATADSLFQERVKDSLNIP